MEEVTKQLGPTVMKVDRLDRTMRSLYSNGSGGPPGYLETARAEDDERYARLFQMVEDIRESRRKLWQAVLHIGWKIAIAVFGAFVALMSWAYHASAPVIKILWEDYLKAHPMVMEKLKTASDSTDPAVSSSHKPTEYAGSAEQ